MIKIRTKKLSEKTAGFRDIIDITAKVKRRLEAENIVRGQVTLFVSDSTAALTTIEYEPGLIEDLKEFVENSFRPVENTITATIGTTTTAFLTRAPRFSAHRWPFPLTTARSPSALGSKSFYWTSITARAPARLLFSS